MNAAHRPERQVQRWYAPDYRRQLRNAGAFRTLSASAQVVLAALGDRANAAGVAWPAVETIARDYGLAESTVRRALGELAGAGLIILSRRAGKVSRYALVIPLALRGAGPTPLESGGDPSGIEPPPLSNPAPIMTMDHFMDHEKQHNSAEPVAGVVVVEEEEISTEEPAAAAPYADRLEKVASDGPIDLLEPDVVARARELQLAPAKLHRYGSARVRAVIEALSAERGRRAISSPAGWVMQALRENWQLPGVIIWNKRDKDGGVAVPPKGTRWARPGGASVAVEILDMTNERVKLVDGSVIPAHHWEHWEWLTERPCMVESTGNAQKPGGEMMSTDVAIAPEMRTTLARVTAWAAVRPRAAAELAAKLVEVGVTCDEWRDHRATQAGLGANL